jgi:hypothetical protein
MTEIQQTLKNPDVVNQDNQKEPLWTTLFREGMTTSKMHCARGMSEKVEVPPFFVKIENENGKPKWDDTKLQELYNSIDIPSDRSPLELDKFHDLSLKALNFAIPSTPLYSGITAQEFYKTNEEDISIAEKGAKEFADILTIIVGGNIQELNLPEPVSEFLINSRVKNEQGEAISPSAYDIRRGVERGIFTAKQCEACEQADPVVGAQFHIASAIVTRLYKESTFTEFWNEAYKGSPADINNPQTVGLVDLIIIAVRDNKDRFPVLDKFCDSTVKLGEGEDAFEGTYYDMVDTPAYQAA